MIPRRYFSKDPKVYYVRIKDFYERYNYFENGISSSHYWTNNTRPCEDTTYFKFTKDKLIAIEYGITFSGFTGDVREKLEKIYVCLRNGEIENQLLESYIESLKNNTKSKSDSKTKRKINNIKKVIESFPEFDSSYREPRRKQFKSYLVNTKYKTSKELDKKYVVFDVETNGTRTANDDLLSISIYNPLTGICYNRFLPLDNQPLVLTTFVNGITDDMVSSCCHMTQEEMDEIIKYFDLNNATLLSFSGGKGKFDSEFVINYCKRHNISGFEKLEFKNIKSYFPKAPFGSEGQMSKDNLCRLFGIEGVNDVHSGINDCLLEWKLFEKLEAEPLFFIKDRLYKYNSNYIIPISYAIRHPELPMFAKAYYPEIEGEIKKVFEYSLPKKALKNIKKFDTNITGIALENSINHLLSVSKQDNMAFLAENRKNIEYVGTVGTRLEEIPVFIEDDGTITSLEAEYKEQVDEVNFVTSKINEHLESLISFIKKNIFNNESIMSQELVISDDGKILALCDLSSTASVMEIKTYNCLIRNEMGLMCPSPALSKQMFYQSKGRNTYLLMFDFETHFSSLRQKRIVDDLSVFIYKIFFKISDAPRPDKLTNIATKVLNELIKNGSETYPTLSKNVGYGLRSIQSAMNELCEKGYIIREGNSRKSGKWVVLKDSTGNEIKAN